MKPPSNMAKWPSLRTVALAANTKRMRETALILGVIDPPLTLSLQQMFIKFVKVGRPAVPAVDEPKDNVGGYPQQFQFVWRDTKAGSIARTLEYHFVLTGPGGFTIDQKIETDGNTTLQGLTPSSQLPLGDYTLTLTAENGASRVLKASDHATRTVHFSVNPAPPSGDTGDTGDTDSDGDVWAGVGVGDDGDDGDDEG